MSAMKKWEELHEDKQFLVFHRCTRALHESIRREEVVAMVSMLALESRVTPEVLSEVLKTTNQKPDNLYLNATHVYRTVLGKINERCGFNAEKEVSKILQEEGVDMAPSDMLLQLVMRIAV